MLKYYDTNYNREMKVYKADELFSVRVKKETSIKNENRELSFPFNLSFEIMKERTDDFSGPGIYAITYKDEVIYIGSYSSPNAKIINERWEKHIQTLTNRGYRIGFNSKSKHADIPFVFRENFTSESYRFCDTGTVTSIERLNFAAKFVNEFNSDDNFIIKDFCFHYQQLNKNENAKSIESKLLKEFKTMCNRKSKNTKVMTELKIENVIELLKRIIK
jgi:hypothetical protein